MKKKLPTATTNEVPRLLPAGHKYIIDEDGNIGRKVSGTVNGSKRWIVVYVEGKYHAKVSHDQLRDYLLAEKAERRASRARRDGTDHGGF